MDPQSHMVLFRSFSQFLHFSATEYIVSTWSPLSLAVNRSHHIRLMSTHSVIAHAYSMIDAALCTILVQASHTVALCFIQINYVCEDLSIKLRPIRRSCQGGLAKISASDCCRIRLFVMPSYFPLGLFKVPPVPEQYCAPVLKSITPTSGALVPIQGSR